MPCTPRTDTKRLLGLLTCVAIVTLAVVIVLLTVLATQGDSPNVMTSHTNLTYQEKKPRVEDENSTSEGVRRFDPDGYSWKSNAFGPCSASCGGGVRTREVWCELMDSSKVSRGQCSKALEPPSAEECAQDPCAPMWKSSEWGPCSQTCGNGGKQTRQVFCEQIMSGGRDSPVNPVECLKQYGYAPPPTQNCGEGPPCPRVTEETTSVSSSPTQEHQNIPKKEKVFVVHSNEKKEWHEALLDCRARNMTLASTENEEEYQKLVRLLKSEKRGIDNDFWLSGNDLLHHGQWVWESSGHKVTWTKWGFGQPSKSKPPFCNSGETENCMEIITGSSYTMNDWCCSMRQRYVCEYWE